MKKTEWLSAGLLACALALASRPTSAQPLRRDQLAGRWIGVSTEWDINQRCPLPACMDLRPDSSWQLSLIGNGSDARRGSWALDGNVLRLDTTHYAPELISLRADQLRIGRVVPMTFQRYSAVAINREAIWQQLSGQVWQSDRVQYLIAPDGRVALRNRQTGTQTVHYAEVVALDESAFLVISGNAHNREGNVREFWQVIGTTAGELRLLGSFGPDICTETLYHVGPLETGKPLLPTVFQPCSNCLAQYQSLFAPGLIDRSKAFDQIRQAYQSVEAPGQSGLIRLSFVQNCAGERSLVDVQEFDLDYKRRPFDNCITDQLRSIVQQDLSGHFFSDASSPTDAVVSFTLRLTNGRLTDLF